MEADAAFCPSCGTPRRAAGQPTPSNPTFNATPGQPYSGVAGTVYGAPASYSTPAYETPPVPPGNYTPPTAYAGSASSPANFAPPPPPPPSGNYPAPAYGGSTPSSANYGGTPPPVPGSYGSASGNNYGIPPVPPTAPTQKKAGLSKGMLALIIVLLVVLVLGGGAVAYYASVLRPAQVNADATATAKQTATADADSTQTANKQATATVGALAKATANAQATVGAQATAGAKGTATAQQSVYTQATGGTPAINDSLSAQSGSNWDTGTSSDGTSSCQFTNGAFHMTQTESNFYTPCYASGAGNFDNVAIEVDMTIVKGDKGGIVFRADSTAHKQYSFQIGSNGDYYLRLATNDTNDKAILFNASPLIKTNGQSNTITVIARGSSLTFFINKQYVTSTTDTTLTSGLVGLVASDDSASTEIAFSNFRAWKL